MQPAPLETVEFDPPGRPRHTIIWLHGLGDSGHGFAPIAHELALPESLAVRWVFPHAPIRAITINNGMQMRAWYDIRSLDFANRAEADDLPDAQAQVSALIDQELADGRDSRQVILAGFSQGGVMALHAGLRYPKPLGGLIALSCYLARPAYLATEIHPANRHTPVWMGHGLYDEVVPISAGRQAKTQLEQLQLPCQWHEYPMQHTVCGEQILAMSVWLNEQLSRR